MKKTFLSFFVFLFIFIGCSDTKGEQKNVANITSENSIAIGKFILSGSTSQSQYADLLSDFRSYIDDSFSKNSEFKVINKQRVDEILATNGLYESVKIKKRGTKVSIDAIKKYKEANAEYVLLGEIRNFNLDVLRGNLLIDGAKRTLSKKHMVLDSYVSVSLIHVETQEIIAKENLQIKEPLKDTSNSDTLISNALSLLSEKIVSKLLLSMAGEIKVISVQDNEIVLNKGFQNGLKEDMTFDIYKNKKISEYITQEKIATVKIIRTDKKISFAKLMNIKELPSIDNIAKAVDIQTPKIQDEKIRVAIADTYIKQSSIISKKLKDYISSEMEYLLSQDSSFVVTRNDMKEYDKVLAQQLLSNLSQGREPGLPMGSLRGVDYLVLTSIDYVYYKGKKVSIEHLESLDLDIKKEEKAEAKMSGYAYLVNVGTGNRDVSVPIDINYVFNDTKYALEATKSLAKNFSSVAISSMISKLKPLKIIQVLSPSQVLLTSGKTIGLQKGDELIVYGHSQRVVNEYTGTVDEISGVRAGTLKVDYLTKSGNAVANITSGVNLQKGFEVELVKKEKSNNSYVSSKSFQKPIGERVDNKKYVIIKKLSFSDDISDYRQKKFSKSNISKKIREKINKSSSFTVLSRNSPELKAILEEKQLANSDISDDFDTSAMRLSLTDYIVFPKITNLELSRTSKKIPNIESFENKDFINVEMSLVLMNTKGQIIHEETKSKKYSRAWASESRLKSSIPPSKKLNSLVSELTTSLVDDFTKNEEFN